MAKTVVTTDDIDGSSGAETVTFAYAGTAYEIDLSRKNTAAFEKVLKPYLEAARSTGTPSSRRRAAKVGPTGRRAKSDAASTHDLPAVRAWATENGHTVSSRGRIAQDVLDAYDAANA